MRGKSPVGAPMRNIPALHSLLAPGAQICSLGQRSALGLQPRPFFFVHQGVHASAREDMRPYSNLRGADLPGDK